MSNKIRKTAEEWRAQLTDEQYQVTRLRGTEPPFTGEYEDYEGAGVYHCGAAERRVPARHTLFPFFKPTRSTAGDSTARYRMMR